MKIYTPTEQELDEMEQAYFEEMSELEMLKTLEQAEYQYIMIY